MSTLHKRGFFTARQTSPSPASASAEATAFPSASMRVNRTASPPSVPNFTRSAASFSSAFSVHANTPFGLKQVLPVISMSTSRSMPLPVYQRESATSLCSTRTAITFSPGFANSVTSKVKLV